MNIYIISFAIGFAIGAITMYLCWKDEPEQQNILSAIIIGGVLGGLVLMFVTYIILDILYGSGGEPYDYPGEHMIYYLINYSKSGMA